ncbi:MAG TPA: polyprenyl synthetase family protein [Phycisphaerae bacterium]|nr:polyprenyl synthetase family protein [Phycisphaerae bacterium]
MKTVLERQSPINAALQEVNAAFDAEVRSDLRFVAALLDQVRSYRGKLLRPRLLLLTAEAVGRIRREHIVLGAVVEMVHMATLVHDDVLDEADVRRRSRSVNRTVGNEGAVLLGDYLISHAYHLCSSLGSTRASRRIAAVTNTVCEGELMQIARRGDLALSEADYLEIIRRKTAALTSVCCELGAETAGADQSAVENMTAFGMDLGVAFQIVDDVLDLTATENETGKSVGRDADMGKLTLPMIRFLQGANEGDRERFRAALSSDHGERAARVGSLLNGTGAIEYAMEAARSYIVSATSHLSNLADGWAREELFTTADFVIRRRQ